MDTKRVLIATALCLAILLGWTELSNYMGWTPAPQIQENIANQDADQAQLETSNLDASAQEELSQSSQFVPQDGREITIDTPLYTAVFHTSGAILKSFKLKKYSAALGEDIPVEMISEAASQVSPMGILYSGQPTWHIGSWSSEAQSTSLDDGEKATLKFMGDINGIQFIRSLTFSANTYLIEEDIEILSQTPQTSRISFTLATTSLASPENSYDTMKVVYDDEDLEEENNIDDLTEEGYLHNAVFSWAGLASNYFLAAVAPVSDSIATLKARIVQGVWRVALEENDIMLQANTAYTMNNNWWFGPKDHHLLEDTPQNLVSSTNLGFFDIIARPMVWFMEILYSFIPNWGVAIIIFTILIKLAFWPLTRSSFTSMEKMKRIQPMVKEIQEKYKDNREALSKETMQLYRTYGVNPLGGCLPILVQIPVFFALYQALLQSLALRHSSFITYLPFTDIIWLADLSAKDPLYITPIVMGGTMFLQQYMSPAMGDPTQRKMMLMMPIIFTFMFLNFPSGLVLYWLMSNVFSIIQQWYTLRKIK